MSNAGAGSGAPAGAELVDIGVNLTHGGYAHDRTAVLQRAVAVGVTRMVVTGASVDSTREAIELARANPTQLRCTAGCHPHYASELTPAASAALAGLASAPEVVAIGECGLDYHRNLSSPAVQRAAFALQLEIATASGKPVFLHQRDAHDDFLAILAEHPGLAQRSVAHCFTGSGAELEACLELGLYIGITGWICDERRGHHLRDIVGMIPAGRLMVETDGPYLLPRDLVPRPASRRNEPMFLPHIAAVVAQARGESFVELAGHTTRCAREFFGI
jgi:TatD DNase family protein